MKAINDLIEYIETEDTPKDPPTGLLNLFDKLKDSPDKALTFYLNLKQFQVPKQQATNVKPMDDDDKNTVITFNGSIT